MLPWAGLLVRSAVSPSSFYSGFGGRVFGGRQCPASRAVTLRVFCHARFCSPAGKFVGIEMRIAGIGEISDDAAGEFHQHRVCAVGRSGWVVIARRRVYGFDQAAAKQARNIDLVRALAKYDAASLRGV